MLKRERETVAHTHTYTHIGTHTHTHRCVERLLWPHCFNPTGAPPPATFAVVTDVASYEVMLPTSMPGVPGDKAGTVDLHAAAGAPSSFGEATDDGYGITRVNACLLNMSCHRPAAVLP